MSFKTQEDYLKEIAEQINNAKCYEIENPSKEDILKLKDFDYIITKGLYFPVMIRRRYMLETVFNIPTIFWYDGYEIGDNVMGMMPETLTVDEVLEELRGFKGEIDVDHLIN